MHLFNQVSRAAMLLLALTATSQTVLAQSRTCIIDEVNGQHRCGYLADEQGYRIADRPVYTQPAPVVVAPVMPPAPVVIGRPGSRSAFEERQAAEQKRMEVQEWVNSLFLDVLGRDADIVTLRRVAGQVMEGRAMSDVRIELATSAEARVAVNQIYRDILRRDADPSGLNAQMAGLRSGLTLSQIRQAIADSPEGRNRR
ncbi:MAG: hypothetical protein ABL923_01825 [Burkholderiaceae bacterium]